MKPLVKMKTQRWQRYSYRVLLINVYVLGPPGSNSNGINASYQRICWKLHATIRMPLVF